MYLETPWRENLRRNAGRLHAAPESVISRMLGNLVPPEMEEARHADRVCL